MFQQACATGGCLQSKCATALTWAFACRFMKPIDPAAEGALEDPASTYADCRAVVERGLEELQVHALHLTRLRRRLILARPLLLACMCSCQRVAYA